MAVMTMLFTGLQASTAFAVPPPEPMLAVGAGFNLLTFFDLNDNGIADSSNGLSMNAPFYQSGSKDGFTEGICKTSPLESGGICAAYVLEGTQVFEQRVPRSNKGDLGFQRDFEARAGQNYKAAALVSFGPLQVEPQNMWARLTVVGGMLADNQQVDPECNDEIQLSKINPTLDPAAVPLVIRDCEVLLGTTGTQKVHAKLRLHSSTTSAAATMIVREFSFERCPDSGCLVK